MTVNEAVKFFQRLSKEGYGEREVRIPAHTGSRGETLGAYDPLKEARVSEESHGGPRHSIVYLANTVEPEWGNYKAV